MKRKILIATSNAGKLRDFAGAAARHGIEIAGIPEFASLPSVVEDGHTFEENARKKAEGYSRYVPGKIVVADDSGLEVDALNGEPGVHSARYAAPDLHNKEPHEADANTDDVANNARVLRELSGVPAERRTGRFVCVLAAARDGETLATFRGTAEGIILDGPRGTNGFGYDPLFYFPSIGKAFAELTAEEKAEYSHRGKAFRELLEWCDAVELLKTESVASFSFALPEALIFDLDGVLVDSEPLHKRAKEQAFAEFGIVLAEDTYDAIKGQPDETALKEILEKRGSPEIFDQLMEKKSKFYRAIQDQLQAIPGAVDFVRWAKSRFRMALATSSTTRNRRVAFDLLGVEDQFEVIVDASRHRRPKPDPEVFLVAIRDLGLRAEECWIIEDSVNGLRAAKAAGCVAVGITTTFDRAKLSAAGADIVVESFRRLREVIERNFGVTKRPAGG